MEVRTRFAPSPTGYMHIGNLRTALYTYLIAKKDNGKFILRIEDTDQERYVEGATQYIYDTMKLVGLEHDEGPDVGGPYGPYIQSERRSIYKEYAKKLVEVDGGYYCFCSKERLDTLRKETEEKGIPFKYDEHCRNMSKEGVAQKISEGMPYVIRQKVPKGRTITFDDLVYGSVTVDTDTLDDGVMLKSDGLPTYNFANVVDDYLMKITHVVRGSEYLSSSPKYNLVYEAFGWEIPAYVHVPPIMKDAGAKFSKRNRDASFQDYLDMGYLKDALINFISLLGWSPRNETEIFSMDYLREHFDIEGLNKSPAVFDQNKLRWMNGEYIKRLSADEFYERALPYLKESIKKENVDLRKISEMVHTRVDVFSGVGEVVDFIDNLPDYDIEIYVNKKMKTDILNSLENLKRAKEVLEGVNDWSDHLISETLMNLVAQLGIKNGQMLWPVRIAVTGKQSSPGGAGEMAALLGKEESLRRIDIGILKLEATK